MGKVLIVDACHVGTGREAAPDPAFLRNVHELATGFSVIAASTAEQKAHEMSDTEHGVFTHYLLEGLRGPADRDHNDFVTVDEVKKHTLNGLRTWYTKKGKVFQDPSHDTQGIGDMVVVDFPFHQG